MSMLYNDDSGYSGAGKLGRDGHGQRNCGGRSMGGYPMGGIELGGAITKKTKKGLSDYAKVINDLKKVTSTPKVVYSQIKADLHNRVLGRKPTGKETAEAVKQYLKSNGKSVTKKAPAKKTMAKKAPAKKTMAKKNKLPAGRSAKSLQKRVKKLSMKDRHELAKWLAMKGAGEMDMCPMCEGSGGPLSGFFGMLGLGDEMDGGAWYDDLWSGVKQGVDIGTKVLPFVLA